MWTGRTSLTSLTKMPLIWSSVLALIVVGVDIELPRWLLRATGLMGDFTIPIMQFTLGVSLAQLQLGNLPRSLGLSLFKLGMGGAVGLGVALALGLEGVALGVMVLDCAMPVAVVNYMFASKYERDPEDVASVIVLSTLLSFLTLPLVLSMLLPHVGDAVRAAGSG